MNCLLCDEHLPHLPSWRGLFLNDLPALACRKCKGGFERIEGVVCRYCGKQGSELCNDCSRWETTAFQGTVTGGTSLYAYNKSMQSFMNQYKFLQDVALAGVFAPELREALKKQKATIVPIPVHPERLRERTFAQVAVLLEASGLPYVSLLEKTQEVQGQKTREARLAAAQLFTWNGGQVPEKIILVDDVYTTGTTMRHAAKALKDAGAKQIHLFSLARS